MKKTIQEKRACNDISGPTPKSAIQMPQPESGKRSRVLEEGLFVLLIVALIFAVYFPVFRHKFHETWDDNAYITHNERVLEGVTPGNVVWAFSNLSVGFYYPLTWISHMVDIELFGLNPAGHYLTNLVIHSLNAVLLFLLLGGITRERGPRLFFAALFAVHPMNVESVAWLAERKNILAAFFLLLAFWSYARSLKGEKAHRYLVHIFYLLGLMSKSSIVMFPVLLVILEFWPLGGGTVPEKLFTRNSVTKLVKSKILFFCYSAVFGFLTLIAQKDLKTAVLSLDVIPFSNRIAQAITGYWFYLQKLLLPFGLCTLYPHQLSNYSVAAVGFLLLALAAFTYIAWRVRHGNPAVLAGWSFFILSLLPVIGLIQVGGQAYADRYVYFPYWGLFAIAVFGLPWKKATAIPGFKGKLPAVAASCVILLFSFISNKQLATWKNDIVLWTRTITIRPNAGFAYYQLGVQYDNDNDDPEKPLFYYEMTLELLAPNERYLSKIRSYFVKLGNHYSIEKKDERKAITAYERALGLDPGNHEILNNIAGSYVALRMPEKAIEYADMAIKADPGKSAPHYNKACALMELGRVDEAMKEAMSAVEFLEGAEDEKERLAGLLDSIGRTFGEYSRPEIAEKAIGEAARLAPGNPVILSNHGYALRVLGDSRGAEEAFLSASRLAPDFDMPLFQLALMDIEKGDRTSAGQRLTSLKKMRSPLAVTLERLL